MGELGKLPWEVAFIGDHVIQARVLVRTDRVALAIGKGVPGRARPT